MSTLYYFAYGSNLHPVRLQNRVPSARFMGLVAMTGYRLCFHKRHHSDNSGKCNMWLTHQNDDVVHGALFEIQAHEKPLLDQCEGVGYRCDSLQVSLKDVDYDCFVYIAEDSHIDDNLVPHSWYQDIVLVGAEHHNLPDNYLEQIRRVKCGQDPDAKRHQENIDLIDQMRAYSAGSESA